MSIISKVKKVRDALLTLNCDVYHYTRNDSKASKYIIWMEQGQGNGLQLNDKKDEQSISGTIDFYTKDEYDSIVDEIQDALNVNYISFTLTDIQYEEENDIIHYTWEWEL